VDADLVVRSAAVHTMAGEGPPATAVGIRGERIVALGADAEAREWTGPRTRTIDVRGGAILPGFQDAHVHPALGGVDRLRCDLDALTDRESYRRAIRAYADSHRERPWILGGGWRMPAFPGGTPTRADLDDVVPDRPVYLTNADGHGAWVNGRALELAGVTRDTPDPSDGRIERDPSTGEPTGTLHEGAMDLVERFVPETTPAELEAGIADAQRYLHSLGITAWQDAWVEPDVLRAYRDVDDRGDLSARVVASLWWDRAQGLEQVDELIEQRRWATRGNVRATTVKIMLDGVCENFTASMLEPYLDEAGRPTGNRGLRFVEPEALRAAVTKLHSEGFQVHFHAIGDRAVRDALDAVEAAVAAEGPRDLRHHVAHLQVVHPDDVPRFAALGVTATAQPLWACHESQMDDLTIPFLGPDRSARQYPFRSILRAGGRIAGGSDWSVSTPDPLPQIEVAVTRTDPEHRGGEPLHAEEAIALTAAFGAFTTGSAYVNRHDDDTGTIEPGKLADVVVLDRDPFAPDAGPAGDARAVLTIAGGRVVHDAVGG
jgi:predicted amidohydrolase YtcJ